MTHLTTQPIFRSPAVPASMLGGFPGSIPLNNDADDACLSDHDPDDAPNAAIIRLVIQEIPRLQRFARSMARDATLADDLVQECLERALARLHLWQPGSNLRAWLFTILRNLHINGLRRRQPILGIDEEALEALGAVPGSQFVSLELRDMRRALLVLPSEQRRVVLLVGLEGVSYGEAATQLGISLGTVKSRLSRGRQALRRLVEGECPSDRLNA
jgi:RNA polymerase sigma factor (sigma-70 family)